MDQGFSDILKQLAKEQSSAALTEARKCKALLADYTKNGYTKESRLLLQAVEAGIAKAIDGADDLAVCKKAKIGDLEEEYSLTHAAAADIVDTLALVLRGDTTKTEVGKPSVEKDATEKAATKKPAAFEKSAAVPTSGNADAGKNTFTDPRDGKVYRTVKIGSQVWMAENLSYNAPGSIFYNNDPKNGEKYGRLYNWETAMKASPTGWHLPSDEELKVLINFVGGKDAVGKHLKAKSGWSDNKGQNGNGLDTYGFAALPGGIALPDGIGYSGWSSKVGNMGIWWSSSEYTSNEVYFWSMYYNDEGMIWYRASKKNLHSIRCVKD
jgi:uncharacterized protein (TIGR02145 family)